MAKFNLKEHITKNKSTFFGSLNEGQFSWMTQDTGQQIGSEEENTIPVYMFDDKGKFYYEPNYDGYGEFGGMDYYELLDKMNGGRGDRGRGIDLAFGSEKVASRVLFPALVTSPSNFNYKTHDFTKEAESDPNQSWYAPEEDDFYDQNDEEVYGYEDDEEELDESKTINTKMKKSELKDKIKEMILNEINLDIDNMEDAPESEVDFLAELEGMLSEESPMNDPRTKQVIQMLMDMDVDGETMEYILRQVGMEDQMANQLVNNPAEYAASLGEAKGDEEVTDDVTADDVTIDDTETIDTTTTTEVNPDVKAVQDALTQAQAAAQKLGDGKLTDQIGNTITFFTRAHVVEKGAVAEVEEMEEETLNESMFPMLKRILK